MKNSLKLEAKQRRFQMNKKAFIFMAVMCMGIGFAFLSSNLTINGNTSVSGNKWNVYFTNVQVSENSVEATVVPTTSGTTTTSLNYTVTLDKPGDFYEFTVDAVNNGTIDAMIESITIPNIESSVLQYVSYSATYSDGTALAQNDVLKKGSTTTYKIRVEFKKDIEPTDLSEDNINLTLTFGVNYVQSNIKPVVSQFAKLIKDSALSDTGINFVTKSSASNGRGLYVMHDTTEDDYPIYYYRGKVTNNNAKFAGFCWKIVRTTETGGTKLIYNGSPRVLYPTKSRLDSNQYKNIDNSGTYPYVYNSDSGDWTSTPTDDIEEMEITFSVEEAGDYFFNYRLVSESYGLYGTLYKDQEEVGSLYENNGTIELFGLTSENVIKVVYSKHSWEESESSGTDSLSFNMEKGVDKVVTCNTTETQIASGSKFNSTHTSIAYNGYMYGTVYRYGSVSTSSSDVYGNTFTYENGTYTLSDTHEGVDSTHHYTCLSSGTTCESVKYVFYVNNSSNAYYIILTDGKSVEDALREMNTNTNNSAIKTVVDNWFKDTFKTYFTNNSKDYNDYLEDTVWCNDRSMNTTEVAVPSGWGNSSVNNGWNPNGGSTENHLWYSSYARLKAGAPRLDCPNKNDSFTVTETEQGNGALTYPVGLLTADEINLAGGQLSEDSQVTSSDINTDFYLYTSNTWWSMSPYYLYVTDATGFSVDFAGRTFRCTISYSRGVRPSISLKPGVKVAAGGDGTVENPYEFIVE